MKYADGNYLFRANGQLDWQAVRVVGGQVKSLGGVPQTLPAGNWLGPIPEDNRDWEKAVRVGGYVTGDAFFPGVVTRDLKATPLEQVFRCRVWGNDGFPETQEQAVEIKAVSAEDAAQHHAGKVCSLRDLEFGVYVVVWDSEGNATKWSVEAEVEIEYHTYEVETQS